MSAYKKTSNQKTHYFHLETMEERILFSADAAFAVVDTAPVTAIDVALLDQASNEDLASQDVSYYLRKELVIVDSALPDADGLLAELNKLDDAKYDVVILNDTDDSISEIGNLLKGYNKLSAVHLLSHGASGEVQLGSESIDTMDLLARASDIASWRTALAPDADFLLYGCDVAADGEGRQFVDTFARLTGADVNASSDVTGATTKGGDWKLEYQRGKIESGIVVSQEIQSKYDATLAIHTVSSLNDAGAGTLREAITNSIAGDSIEFSVAGTISLNSELPSIVVQVIIDGSSAPGYADSPVITIDGTNLTTPTASGLVLDSGSDASIIKNVSIVNFPNHGISISDSSNHIIQSNYIGTDGTNNLGNGSAGISISSSSGITIGGDRDAGEGNVISGNDLGVDIEGANSSDNLVYGNDIGTNAVITAAIPNQTAGVKLSAGATFNQIGGIRSSGWGNTISGNGVGVILTGGATDYNQLFGNRIGVNYDNTIVIGNTGDGVQVLDASSNNLIGGPENGEGQTISGNVRGVYLSGAGTDNNLIQWSWIGVGNDGVTPGFGNSSYGVEITNGASYNTVGGVKGNTISGNAVGISINGVGTSFNQVKANNMGVDVTGAVAMPNEGAAIEITGAATSNTIGGDVYFGEGNVLSGNGDGIVINGVGTDDNNIEGNRIGIQATYTDPLGNTGDGVRVEAGASNNNIGHTIFGRGNFIGDNTNGVVISGAGTESNTILGNHIGSGFFGTEALGNSGHGILIENGASNTIIGDSIGRNYIVDNDVGIGITDGGTSNNTVLGNHIGVVRGSASALANTSFGIQISNSASGNTIGGSSIASAELNHISGNGVGIDIGGIGTNANIVKTNIIGLNGSTDGPMGNTTEGIRIHSGASSNIIGGDDSFEINIIGGNQTGVYIGGANTTNNEINWNFVGLNAAGDGAVGNTGSGIVIADGASNNSLGTQGIVVIGGNDIGLEISGSGTTGNTITQTVLGYDATFEGAIGNTNEGIKIHNQASSNVVDGVVSGFNSTGISISGANTDNNSVRNTSIGYSAVSTAVGGNSLHGVLISEGAQNNTIGGSSWASAGNTIIGNGTGVSIQGVGTNLNTVTANVIGTNDQSAGSLGNTAAGVEIVGGAALNDIGGSVAGLGNVISQNNIGIFISGSDDNKLHGNLIGTNIDGTAGLGNTQAGIEISGGSQGNAVGGSTSDSRNIISDNSDGVVLSGDGTSNNTLFNNYIGTNVTGDLALGNSAAGIRLDSGAEHNEIGGDKLSAEGNLISGNGIGIVFSGNGTSNNEAKGNLIGTTADGSGALGNLAQGILIDTGASHNIIGGSSDNGLGNVISANLNSGIFIDGAQTNNNDVFGNLIGTTADGDSALGNGLHGVQIVHAEFIQIGTATGSGMGNTISANSGDGIYLFGAHSAKIQSNYIGTSSDGISELGNAGFGVLVDEGSTDTLIGVVGSSGERNIISGNVLGGVKVDGANNSSTSTASNTISGNYIGTAADGLTPIGNGDTGVEVTGGAENTTVGGDRSAA